MLKKFFFFKLHFKSPHEANIRLKKLAKNQMLLQSFKGKTNIILMQQLLGPLK